MRRSITILIWILVGAVASGGGIGYFLHQANVDRTKLAEEAETARQNAEEAKAANKVLADEANQKLDAAAKEVLKAQDLLKRYEWERDLMAKTPTLEKPPAATLKYWSEAITIPLGLSLRLPPGSVSVQPENGLTAFTQNTANEFHREQWLAISPYDRRNEQDLSQGLSATSTLTYLVDGRLLIGVRGRSSNAVDPYPVYVFHVESAASSTHLIWAHATPLVPEKKILETLATLSFRS